MNNIVLFGTFLLLGFCSSSKGVDVAKNLQQVSSIHESHIIKQVLRRSARSAVQGMAQQYLTQFQKIIITNCQDNGHDDAAEKLQPVFDELRDCLREKKMFVTPKDEFLAHLEECSKEPIKETNSCLKENQRYITELILDLAKSRINFMYDDIDIIRTDMAPCVKKINNYQVIGDLKQCIREVAVQNHDSRILPPTKAEFCRRFIPTAYCFTNMVKEHCGNTPGLVEYRENYIKSHKEPCEEK